MGTRKYKLRFTKIDVFVVVLLLLGLSVTLFLPKGTPCRVRYTLLFTVDSTYEEVFSCGCRLLDGTGKEFCGTITAVESADALGEGAAGTFTVTQKKRIFVTAEGAGKEKNGVITIGSLTPLPGKRLFFHAPCHAEAICLSVDVCTHGDPA